MSDMWSAYRHIVPHVAVGSGVIDTVPEWVLSQGYKTLLVVTDPNTRRIAGERVVSALLGAGLTVLECRLPESEPLPDEASIGRLTAAFNADIDLILGVGSGTINDLCTFVGAKVGVPSAIVGTAPSMDGYASLGSAMLLDGLKVTPPTQCASAIFCDTDILKDAPLQMIASGLGDMLGKYSALADWKLSHILTGEPMPEGIVSLVETALRKCAEGARIAGGPQAGLHSTGMPDPKRRGNPRADIRDPQIIQSITEGLILSGIAMSLYGDSRPASGTEHHLAHYWEMRYCMEGKKPVPHGIKVGLAAIAALAMWKELPSVVPGRFSAPPDPKLHEERIRSLYGISAENIIKTQNPNLPAEHIAAHWDEILEIANSIPAPEVLASMLTGAGAPVRPSEIALDETTLTDSVVFARERKKTYTLLQLLGDLGRLEDFARRTVRYFENNVLAGVKCFVLDMDGTIYLGGRLFPFTPGFLRRAKESGRDFVFFTNNSSQNTAFYLNKLERMGIPVPPEKMLMSTHVLLDYLKSNAPGKHVFAAGTDALISDFRAAGYEVCNPSHSLPQKEIDFCVLGFDRDMDYNRLTVLCDLIRSGVPCFGVNMDYNCPVEDGYIPDCGSLATAVKASTGSELSFFGKPSREALAYIIKTTGYKEEELCFVGDRLYTDIAIASGTKARSVLVLSGETQQGDLQSFVPDIIARDLADLEGRL